MWIESALGHSFLACDLLWYCSPIETSDTELRVAKGFIWSLELVTARAFAFDIGEWLGDSRLWLDQKLATLSASREKKLEFQI